MHAGFSLADITPSVGCWLDGFFGRTTASDGVDRPLEARALWLDDERAACLIVALDIIGLTPTTADRLAARLGRELGIESGAVLLTSSHTHAGPMTFPIAGMGPEDADYVAMMSDRIVAAARAAREDRSPAVLSFGRVPVALGINRRQTTTAGTVLGQNPTGPCDAAVHVLHVRRDGASGGGRTTNQRHGDIALMLHACHPYVQGAGTSLISPDFCGHACAAMDAAGVSGLYVNGCAGDIAPIQAGKGVAVARQEGERLARAALEACASSTVIEPASLRVKSREIALPHDAMPPMAELEQMIEQELKTVEADAAKGDGVAKFQARRIREGRMLWLDSLRRALGASDGAGKKSGELPPIRARVSVLSVGRWSLTLLPGEVFFAIGEAIGTAHGLEHSFVAAYGHGFIGYVPTPEAYPLGGYEVDSAHQWLGLWRVGASAGMMLAETASALHRA